MPKQKFALERGGDKALVISWGAFWKNIEIRLNDNLIGTIPDQKELSAGRVFQLPDGSTLKVQLAKSLFSAGLRVLRNDKPLPGSSSDPAARLIGSSLIIYTIAGLNIVLGFIAELFQVEFLQALGIGVISIGIGLIFLVLGFFTQRRSLIALILALILYGADSLLVLFGGFNFGIFVRIVFLIGMAQGVGAIRELKREAPPIGD
jgi:hypothetical protein